MKSSNIGHYIFAFILLVEINLLGCYTKTKIDLSKLADKYEISGIWQRKGGFTSTYRGVTSAFKIDHVLIISENETFQFRCNDHESWGEFEVSGDTVVFIGLDKTRSKYLYKLDGHDLTFIKLDINIVSTCFSGGRKDAFAGTWHYK